MRYKCHVAYNGSAYSGFQRQQNANTIQNEIEKALRRVYNTVIEIHPASRTDKGVHAVDQVFHYDAAIEIPVSRLMDVINRQLPNDIIIQALESVTTDFHARYSVKNKTYQYRLSVHPDYDVFRKDIIYQYNRQVDIKKMQMLAEYFIGTHDFKAFMAAGSDKENTIRHMYGIHFEVADQLLNMYITGSGFLYHMVRIMMGVFLDFSEDKKDLSDILKHFETGNRSFFKHTAPACGLYLLKTDYEDEDVKTI